ncbi:ankyrin repeat domain-containing protein 50-like [Physella acuta]|uniref:ankyrin repeat domain-containing protein 50-like n=1 Tax=Physella acuta TaxID=109671 RepID=UPI0027DBDF38|nr:ankyrin repeat domain-containing protein 50-like [Physella acuta]
MISWSFYCPFKKRINAYGGGSQSMKKSTDSRLNIDINCKDSEDKALVLLSKEKSNNSGELLLNSGTDVNVKTIGLNSERETLFVSTKLGHTYFMHILLKWKTNVNELNGFHNKTASHLFIQRGYEYISYILLVAGVDVNLAYKRGETAFHYAAWFGMKKLVKSLLERGALHYSTGYGSNDIVVLLLEAGASADIKDRGGGTALFDAALFGCMKTTLTLQKFTSDLDAGDQYNNTALHYSSHSGLTEVVKTLLESGTIVDSRSQLGRTPLFCSVLSKNIDEMKEIIQHGANLDIDDDFGQTALDIAIMYLNDEAVAVLRQYGAKSSKENKVKIEVVLDSSKSEMEFKKEIALVSNVTPFASDNTSQSTDTAPSVDTTPTNSTTTLHASDSTNPSTHTKPSMNTTPTASTVTLNASDDTTPSTDTATSVDTTPTTSTTTSDASDDFLNVIRCALNTEVTNNFENQSTCSTGNIHV